jgi:hypothetical protein
LLPPDYRGVYGDDAAEASEAVRLSRDLFGPRGK